MKPAGIIGIILIIIGVIALAYQGFTYTTRETKPLVDIGPIHAETTVEKHNTIPLPPILGIAALAGGIVLLVVGNKRT